jgi:ectoine hydroxylase-related dioxygenase (phytanoyl-CoA dioxygenase family)
MLNLSEYHEKGYVICRKVIPIDALQALLRVLHAALAGQGEGLSYSDLPIQELIAKREREDHSIVYKSQVTVGSSFAAYDLLGKSKVFEVAAQVTQATRQYLHTMPLAISIQNPRDDSYDYTSHQESLFYKWCPDILNIWFPVLAPSTVEGGTMAMLPGSHAKGFLPSKSYNKANGFLQIETILQPGDEERFVPMELDLGDLVVFSSHLVHRSMPNISAMPRVTGILRVVNMATLRSHRPLYKALSYEE